MILLILLLVSITATSQRVERKKIQEDVENNSKTYLLKGKKQVVLKDNRGREVKDKKLKEGTYKYEIKRNGRVIESGTVNTRKRKLWKNTLK